MQQFDAFLKIFGRAVFEAIEVKGQKGKVDLCMTNGSKVLIYLTLISFLQEYEF